MALVKKKQHVSMEEYVPTHFSSDEREARRQMCELIHRAYDQQLFTSTQGTFSVRLGGRRFSDYARIWRTGNISRWPTLSGLKGELERGRKNSQPVNLAA